MKKGKMVLLLSCLAVSGCAPKGCHRESGMFGIFSEKYWSGYTCQERTPR